VALGPVAAGITTVVANYALCPQVTIGENRIDLNVTEKRFTGRIREIRKKVG
jgi:hypothetical protein